MLTKYYSYELCFRPWETQSKREREGKKKRTATLKHPEVERREEEARSLITSISQRARVPVSTWVLSQCQSQKRGDIILTQQTVYSGKVRTGASRRAPARAETGPLLISQKRNKIMKERGAVKRVREHAPCWLVASPARCQQLCLVCLFPKNAQVRHLTQTCVTCLNTCKQLHAL